MGEKNGRKKQGEIFSYCFYFRWNCGNSYCIIDKESIRERAGSVRHSEKNKERREKSKEHSEKTKNTLKKQRAQWKNKEHGEKQRDRNGGHLYA